MKKTLTIAALVALGTASAATFAFWGGHGQGMWQGRWQGHGFGRTLTDDQRTQLQSMSQEERQAYVQKLREEQGLTTQQNTTAMQQGGHYGQSQGQGRGQGQQGGQWQAQQNMEEDPSQMIANYPVSNLTDEEKEGLINQYGEEKLARDIYNYAYEKYDVQTFANIAKSEQKHMDAVGALLSRYNISAPTDYAKDNELYVTLKAKVDEGLEQALNVGVTVEEVDIKDIAELAKEAAENNAQDVLAVYTNIAGGSYNHLRGFLQALQNYGYTIPDVSAYLPGITVDQLLQMRGPDAKKLFVDYVNQNFGIDLSNYQQQCQQNQTTTTTTVPTTTTNTTVVTEPTTVSSTVANYVDTTKVVQYKTYIEDKYADKIASYTADQLQDKIQKVDDILNQIVASTSYSDTTKATYVNVLEALKEALQDQLNKISTNETSIIDSVLGE